MELALWNLSSLDICFILLVLREYSRFQFFTPNCFSLSYFTLNILLYSQVF